MYLNELKRQIKTNSYPNVMLWIGPETYAKHFYRDKISNKWTYLDDISSLNTNKNSFFKNIKQYYYVDGQCLNNIPESIFNKEDYKIKLLNSPNVFIFDFKSSFDENGKLTDGPNKFILSEFQDYIISFDKFNDRLLLKYFNYTELTDNRLLKIFKYNNNDYIKCKLELDKVMAYANENNLTSNIAFDILLKQNILIKPIGDVIFDFSNALLSGNLTTTNAWYKMLKLSNEPPLTITSLLYRQFKELYLVKLSGSNNNLLTKLNLSPAKLWVIRKELKMFSTEEIERNLKIIQFVESGIKTGQIDESFALDYLIVNILG